MKTQERTFSLPIVGYFGDKCRKHKHTVRTFPEIDIERPRVSTIMRLDQHHQPFKHWVVDVLNAVRERGSVKCGGNLTEAPYFCEANRLIKPIYLQKDDPLFAEIIYELTPAGEEFLRQHEAPPWW